MGSILPGFEYDIFISYRQNDNSPSRGYGEQGRSGWVTEFVKALESELAATIKEPVSVYFDSNPNDGLLESHNVDKSLEGKLKCLIFIPVLSQTYCDPKGFAWQHEFVAFNKAAVDGELGRDIKLGTGNVACRILPVRIHDLDADDKASIERELGSALRSIDFTYKEPGVNRPLTPDDSADLNLNKTRYKNQVNKVANAVKDVLLALRNPGKTIVRPSPGAPTPEIPRKKKMLVPSLGLALVIVIGYFLYLKLAATPAEAEAGNKSIAVLPFVDMSPAKDQEYLGDGIAEEIITALSHIKELKVIGRTSSFQFKGEKIDLRQVGEMLNVSTVLEGSIMKSGNKVRITAQLINVSDGTHIWSERYDKDMEDIFAIQDQISKAISDKMRISLLGQMPRPDGRRTSSTEAYENYLRGQQVLAPLVGRFAIPFFKKAIELDSNYADAYAGLARAYFFDWELGRTETLEYMRPLAQKVRELDPASEKSHELFYSIYGTLEWNWKLAEEEYERYLAKRPVPFIGHALHTSDVLGNLKGAIEEMKIVLDADPINKTALRVIGPMYAQDHQFEKGKEMINKALEIDPEFAIGYRSLAFVNTLEGDFDSALKNIKRAGELDPTLANSLGTKLQMIITLMTANRVKEAEEYYKSQYDAQGGRFDNYTAQAKIEFRMGHFDKGYDLLEQALEAKDYEVLAIRTSPSFDAVREQPRFKEFMKKVPFPDN